MIVHEVVPYKHCLVWLCLRGPCLGEETPAHQLLVGYTELFVHASCTPLEQIQTCNSSHEELQVCMYISNNEEQVSRTSLRSSGVSLSFPDLCLQVLYMWSSICGGNVVEIWKCITMCGLSVSQKNIDKCFKQGI